MADKRIAVAYFGNYDPSYTRVRTTLKGLRRANIKVIECSSNRHSRLLRLITLAVKFVRVARHVDLIMVSEAGQAYVPLAKALSLITGKPLLVDIYLSYYHIHVIDSKVVRPHSLWAKYFYYLDRIACLMADIAILDTPEHARYFCDEFRLQSSKFLTVPVGSDDELFMPCTNGNGARKFFQVFLVASYYPLHGVEHVVRAAKLLEAHADIRFFIIGNGITRPAIDQLMNELGIKNVTFRSIVPSYILPDLMAKSDICLGQFGDTRHARMVVPAKVYDALAMRKAVITGSGDAVRAVFIDGTNILFVPPADPQALADAILRLKNDVVLRETIAKNGYQLFQDEFSLERTGIRLSTIVHDLIASQS